MAINPNGSSCGAANGGSYMGDPGTTKLAGGVAMQPAMVQPRNLRPV